MRSSGVCVSIVAVAMILNTLLCPPPPPSCRTMTTGNDVPVWAAACQGGSLLPWHLLSLWAGIAGLLEGEAAGLLHNALPQRTTALSMAQVALHGSLAAQLLLLSRAVVLEKLLVYEVGDVGLQ